MCQKIRKACGAFVYVKNFAYLCAPKWSVKNESTVFIGVVSFAAR